jgi:hypothetical protein
MRLEEVTSNNVDKLTTSELRNLRERAIQIAEATESWRATVEKRSIGMTSPIEKDRFFDIYGLLIDTMQKKGLEYHKSPLDMRFIKRRMRGIDVANLPIIKVRENVVAMTGTFVTNPRKATAARVYINDEDMGGDIPVELEKRLGDVMVNAVDKHIMTTRDVEDVESPSLPLYDLVLMPKGGTVDLKDVESLKKRQRDNYKQKDMVMAIDTNESPLAGDSDGSTAIEDGMAIEFSVSKREHVALQEESKVYTDYQRTDDKFEKGIHAVWGVLENGKTKLQSVRFDAEKFTVAAVKNWLIEHELKTSVIVAKAKEKTTFVKNEEQHLVGGIVYGINEVDSQGDYVGEAEEIWKAMETFAIGGHKIKFMHAGRQVNAVPVEIFQAEADTPKGGGIIKKGAWYMTTKIMDDDLWQAAKDGDITGFSMAGSALTAGVV